jgi:hypothetical protein
MRRPRKPATSSALHALVDALPDEALRPLLLELLRDVGMPAPTDPAEDPAPSPRRAYRRRPGSRPPGRKRRGGPGRPRKTDTDSVAAKIIARRRREERRGPGRPRKVETAATVEAKLAARRIRNNELARARRAAAKPTTATDHSNRAGNGTPKPAITPAQLWEHAARISPKTPWRAVARELGTNEAQALDAYRAGSLPPGMTANAIERFFELPAP